MIFSHSCHTGKQLDDLLDRLLYHLQLLEADEVEKKVSKKQDSTGARLAPGPAPNRLNADGTVDVSNQYALSMTGYGAPALQDIGGNLYCSSGPDMDMPPPAFPSAVVAVEPCSNSELVAGLTEVAVLPHGPGGPDSEQCNETELQVDGQDGLDGEEVVDAAGSFRDMATLTLAAAKKGLDPAYGSKNPWYLTWLHVGPVAPEEHRAATFQPKTSTRQDSANPIRRIEQRQGEKARAGQKREWTSMQPKDVLGYSSRSFSPSPVLHASGACAPVVASNTLIMSHSVLANTH